MTCRHFELRLTFGNLIFTTDSLSIVILTSLESNTTSKQVVNEMSNKAHRMFGEYDAESFLREGEEREVVALEAIRQVVG